MFNEVYLIIQYESYFFWSKNLSGEYAGDML